MDDLEGIQHSANLVPLVVVIDSTDLYEAGSITPSISTRCDRSWCSLSM